uniref:Ankyrin repeat and LEM domain-containing protein 2 n=2 Tax=Cacopsylla melanoneura TaxID=428564 RepID=A0A8D8RW63_9HEMI
MRMSFRNVGERVFDNKEEALLFIKKNKKIRFKSFRNFQDAQNFAYNGYAGGGNDGGNTDSLLSSPSSLAVEKPSPFKSLKSQELVKLRKLIEKGNLAEVKKLVWENPRYLVSSGDFPTILHEGCRYNALHVSTKALNAPMTHLLLETIGDPAFTTLLYDGPPTAHTYIERSDILLDLYLNTPDKALNETPLHFASKFGSVECVRRLVTCSKTQVNARNKEGKTPLDIMQSHMVTMLLATYLEVKRICQVRARITMKHSNHIICI